ncbi:hypothetical protein MRQ36_31345 [Micromonospora sp. R77]|uniref:hypothetical protein n=1 Tax=Micromonospora sp. R77 TaxID=2925836 RepID=UPI001F603376|nr:hypothetical protein [Micromonospora sp. R77]MCI4066817.1 hypothetical protein [Micromonospora sp. R77]
MRHPWHSSGVQRHPALSTLIVLAVVAATVRAGSDVGMCIVVRLTGEVGSCVPAWSADRAPPRVPAFRA